MGNGDGRIDLVMGSNSGIDVYVNEGNKVFTKTNSLLTGVESSQHGAYTPAFADLDGDEDFDLILSVNADLRHYENTGDKTSPEWKLLLHRTYRHGRSSDSSSSSSPLKNTYVHERMRPTFVDLDDDGDLDYVCMWNYGFKYYKNTGGYKAAVFEEETGPFGDLSLNGEVGAAVSFNDWNNDGDWDMFVRKKGEIYYWENTGDPKAPAFPSSSGNIQVGQVPWDRYAGNLAFLPKTMTTSDLPN